MKVKTNTKAGPSYIRVAWPNSEWRETRFLILFFGANPWKSKPTRRPVRPTFWPPNRASISLKPVFSFPFLELNHESQNQHESWSFLRFGHLMKKRIENLISVLFLLGVHRESQNQHESRPVVHSSHLTADKRLENLFPPFFGVESWKLKPIRKLVLLTF